MSQVTTLSAAVGRVVAERRHSLDLTQAGLARLLRATGLSWTGVTVAKVENGQRDVSAADLVALGLALGLTPAQMLQPPERVRLGTSDSWVPGDAVHTWAHGEAPTPDQRAQWSDAASDEQAAPVAWLDERARALAAYLSHLPEGRRPAQVRLSDVMRDRAAVAADVAAWEDERVRGGGTCVCDGRGPPHQDVARVARPARDEARGPVADRLVTLLAGLHPLRLPEHLRGADRVPLC